MKNRIFLGVWAGLSLMALSLHAQVTVSTVLTNGLAEPWGVAMDADDNLYISDSVHNRIVKIDAATQAATTLAGLPNDPAGSNDGPAYEAHFKNPEGLIVASGITNPVVQSLLGSTNGLVVADADNHLIRFVRVGDGSVVTLAGNTDGGAVVDGPGSNARFLYPAGLAQGDNGYVYIVDWGNNKIRVLNLNDPAFSVATLVINGTSSYTNLNRPVAVAFASGSGAGNNQLWVADTGNHMVKLITLSNPTNGTLTTYLGGYRVSGTTDSSFGPNARFNGPCGLIWSGRSLLISDTLNNTVRLATNYTAFGPTNYAVTTFVGSGQPGLVDGSPLTARLNSPYTIIRDQVANGFLLTDLKNNAVRRIQSGPAAVPVPTPRIGWVEFVIDSTGNLVSVLRTNQPAVFNNDAIICVEGTDGTQTHFTTGPTPEDLLTDTIPNPSATAGNSPPLYHDGMFRSEVPVNTVTIQPDFTIKAIGFQEGRQISPITSARYQFQTGSPFIHGMNAASFTVSDVTTGAKVYYATALSSAQQINVRPNDPRLEWKGPINTPTNLALVISSNTDFFVYATRDSYATSQVTATTFWLSNYVANKIVFGFEAGEASCEYTASPGQVFVAPVTMTVLPSTKIYSLQFNVTVTNAGPNPGPPIVSGAFDFTSFLLKPVENPPPDYYRIPPAAFLSWVTNYMTVTNIFLTTNGGVIYTNIYIGIEPVLSGPVEPPPAYKTNYYFGRPFVDLEFVDTRLNLLSVGWLERYGMKNLYDTTKHDLIKYSAPHDTLFDQANGRVVLGGYAFLVPSGASLGQTYQIRLGRPSATSDGVGGPSGAVYIETPTSGTLGPGTLNSIKNVVMAQKKYLVGDAAPFRWFNAGEFGNTNLDNSDVMQIFQSAIYELNYPPAGSDFFDSMDSCGAFGVDLGHGYLEYGGLMSTNELNRMFDGDDTDINQVAFGDGILDVCDVYVTFRRSLDPSLALFRRFWANGSRVAEVASPAGKTSLGPPRGYGKTLLSTEVPSVHFGSGDALGSAGQTVQIPITAQVFGDYPLRVLMMNLTVDPLDDSPALDTPIVFTMTSALGAPALVSSKTANYAATWLDSSVAGLTGSNVLGILTVRIPTNATSSSAYAIHFNHASGSPNGLGSFAIRKATGLITLANRTGSTYSDSIPDSWRLRYFGTINNVLSQAAADADGDGMANWQEYLAGTDPLDSTSHLRVSTGTSSKGRVLRWPSIAGKRYIIERAGSVFGNGWIPVSTNVGSGVDLQFSDSGTGNAAFYRVRVAP